MIHTNSPYHQPYPLGWTCSACHQHWTGFYEGAVACCDTQGAPRPILRDGPEPDEERDCVGWSCATCGSSCLSYSDALECCANNQEETP